MSDWWSSPRQPPGAIPFRSKFDAARDPLTARNAIGAVDAQFVLDAIAAAGGGGGGGAPLNAQYVTAAADATLTAERVLTNTATVTWDFTTAGQAKATAVGGGGGSFQPLDDDLTTISGLTGANTIYYRSGPGAWTPVVVGTGLTFTGGTLTATGGAGTVKYTASTTAPVAPTAGDLWYDLTTGVLSVFVNDGNSSAWVQISPPGGGTQGAAPVGSMSMFAGAVAPAGWLLCNGQAVSRTTFAALFAVCGTAYGAGNGSTTFNVPNLVDRFPLGVGAAAMGAIGGSSQLQQHNHGVTDPWHGHGVNDPGHYHYYNSAFDQSVGGDGSQTASVKAFTFTDTRTTGITISTGPTGITIQNAGTGNAQNMPPYQVVNYIIFAGA